MGKVDFLGFIMDFMCVCIKLCFVSDLSKLMLLFFMGMMYMVKFGDILFGIVKFLGVMVDVFFVVNKDKIKDFNEIFFG